MTSPAFIYMCATLTLSRDYMRDSYRRQPQRDRSPLQSGNKFDELYPKDFDNSLRLVCCD